MAAKTTRILVLGATGLLGQAVTRILGERPSFEVYAASRTMHEPSLFGKATCIECGDLQAPSTLTRLLDTARPDVVINCVAAPRDVWTDWPSMIGLFAQLPRRLAFLAAKNGFRFVHISTDGVFSGKTGMYREDDLPDAEDLYGIAKQLGETDNGHTVTLRTSLIGHDPIGKRGLLEWALLQSGECKGFSRAIFSGLPTDEIARVIADRVIIGNLAPGIYHLAAEPISKADLLRLIAERYGLDLVVKDDPSLEMNRSLNADRFTAMTGYRPANWPDLINQIYNNHMGCVDNHV